MNGMEFKTALSNQSRETEISFLLTVALEGAFNPLLLDNYLELYAFCGLLNIANNLRLLRFFTRANVSHNLICDIFLNICNNLLLFSIIAVCGLLYSC